MVCEVGFGLILWSEAFVYSSSVARCGGREKDRGMEPPLESLVKSPFKACCTRGRCFVLWQ